MMLEDVHYYKALNELSGSDVAVFHTRLFQGSYEMPKPPDNFLSMMVPVWREPSENKLLLTLFDLEDSTNLPCLVTFLFWDGKLYCTQSRIEDSSRQEAFNSTSAILKRLSKAGKSASDELNALKRARFEMRKLNFRKGLKEFLQKLGAIRGAAGM